MTLATAVAGLALPVIALAFTAHQWRQSGTGLVIAMSRPTFRPEHGSGRRLAEIEIISASQLPVTVTEFRVDMFGPTGSSIQPARLCNRCQTADLAPHELRRACMSSARRPPTGFCPTISPTDV